MDKALKSQRLSPDELKIVGAQLVAAFEVVTDVKSRKKISLTHFREEYISGRLEDILFDDQKEILDRVYALEECVINSYYKMICRLACNMIQKGSRSEIDDLVQEGCMVLMRSMYTYNGSVQMSSYFANVVLNRFRDIHKTNRSSRHEQQMPETLDVAGEIVSDEALSPASLVLLERVLEEVRPTLDPIESSVLEKYLAGEPITTGKDINPRTNRPMSRFTYSNHLKTAIRKVTLAYKTAEKAA